MTDTTTSTATLALVTVSSEYSGPMGRRLEGEFFAFVPGLSSPAYPTLVLHKDDPRSAGMWEWAGYYADTTHLSALGLEADDHKGWNVPAAHVTVIPDPEPPTPGERFPVGTKVKTPHAASFGEEPGTVLEVDGDRIIVSHACGGGERSTYTRAVLEEHNPTPEAEAEAEAEATPEPYAPKVGDRVRVVRDSDTPRQNGKSATVLEVGGYGTAQVRVRYDEGDPSHVSARGWWVSEVAPLMPSTLEEFTAMLEEAKSKALEEGKQEGRREGKAAADAEFNAWKQMAQETAHQYASDNSLCSEFDRCMVAIGLEPRDTYTRTVEVEVSYSVYVDISGGELVSGDLEEIARERAVERIREGYVDPHTVDVEED